MFSLQNYNTQRTINLLKYQEEKNNGTSIQSDLVLYMNISNNFNNTKPFPIFTNTSTPFHLPTDIYQYPSFPPAQQNIGLITTQPNLNSTIINTKIGNDVTNEFAIAQFACNPLTDLGLPKTEIPPGYWEMNIFANTNNVNNILIKFHMYVIDVSLNILFEIGSGSSSVYINNTFVKGYPLSINVPFIQLAPKQYLYFIISAKSKTLVPTIFSLQFQNSFYYSTIRPSLSNDVSICCDTDGGGGGGGEGGATGPTGPTGPGINVDSLYNYDNTGNFFQTTPTEIFIPYNVVTEIPFFNCYFNNFSTTDQIHFKCLKTNVYDISIQVDSSYKTSWGDRLMFVYKNNIVIHTYRNPIMVSPVYYSISVNIKTLCSLNDVIKILFKQMDPNEQLEINNTSYICFNVVK